MSYIYTTPHRVGLGLVPAAIPVAASVAKNTLSFMKRLFGPKPLVWGLKPKEFEARHENAKWFRGLWYSGYWARTGAPEIPSGMTTQDYYVRRFNLGPMWADSEEILAKFRKDRVPLESLRLTSIPAGMFIPSTMNPETLKRVMPLSVIQRLAPADAMMRVAPEAAVMRAAPADAMMRAVPAVGVSELLRSPVVLIGLGLAGFMLMQKMMRPGR